MTVEIVRDFILSSRRINIDYYFKSVLLDSASFGYFVFTAIGFLLFWLTYTVLLLIHSHLLFLLLLLLSFLVNYYYTRNVEFMISYLINIIKAYGLGAIGINHIRGKKRKEDEENETRNEIDQLQNKIDQINEKYEGTKLPVKVRIELEGLQDRKSYEEKKLGELHQLGKFAKITELLSPIQFLFGAVIYLISIIIIVSIIITLLNRLFDSECLMRCGFTITSNPTLPNPIDLALTYSSMVFLIKITTILSY